MRVDDLGGLVEPTEPGQPGPGEHDGVERAGGDEPDARVDVAADRPDLEAEAERRELGRAPGRAGADDGARRELSERQPVAGDEHVAAVLAHRDGRERRGSGSGAVGRSLSECTATSMRPACSASRIAETKTPVPPIVVSSSPLRSPSVVISTSSTSWPRSREPVGHPARLGRGEGGAAGAEAQERS